MAGGRTQGRGRVVAVAALLALACLASWPAAPRASPTVPLGTAVWWACMEREFRGPVLLGCPLPAHDERYPQALAQAGRPFDTIVAENEMKIAWLEPRQGVFDFAVADRIAAYAQQRRMHVRGHALVFGKALPPWMAAPSRADRWTRDSLLAAMRTSIITVMRHFRDRFPGVVREWDVVNEAFDDDGGYEDNLLLRVIGPDYVELAFRYAREADPDALLFHNEFRADGSGPRADAVLAMAKDFRARGVPLDGIGIQMHLGLKDPIPLPAERAALMARYADLGLLVAITELDVGLSPPFGVADAAEQEQVYTQVARSCAEQPACTGMTVWGVADPLSWRGAFSTPLLIDRRFQAKPALAAVQAILAAAPPRAPVRRRADGNVEVLPVPVIAARRRQGRDSLLTRGLRVRVVCPGSPPCPVGLTLSLDGVRLATRKARILTAAHTLRLRVSPVGAKRLRAARRSGRARLRARVGGGPFASQLIDVVIPRAPTVSARR